jgi:NAD(P)-dependent dehydrogenase (short-subunit alcohol dehydrogenase family)
MMKTALIWGASGGIGRAVAGLLDREQWTVMGISRHPRDLRDLTPHAFEADVSDPAQIEGAVNRVRRIAPEVDLWLYAVGFITSTKLPEMEPDLWRRVLNANLTGAFLATRASLPILAPKAHLFYLGAQDARLRLPGLTAYAASKAALEAFTDSLAKEQRRRRVTLVRPQAVDTDFWDLVPFNKPSGAMAPEALADRILEAYNDGHKGRLDL